MPKRCLRAPQQSPCNNADTLRMKIAILGAESTGKTTLAQTLAQTLNTADTPCRWIGEYLRTWCETHGRTPQPHEQQHIAQYQAAQVDQVDNAFSHGTHGTHSITLVDTTPLMTAIYSHLLFNDTTLYPFALAHQRQYDLCLVTGLDIAWVADGIQRDGPALRQQVDQQLRSTLVQHGIAFHTIVGTGSARTECALSAIAHAQKQPSRHRNAGTKTTWAWHCDACSDGSCEFRLFSAARASPPVNTQ